MRFDREPWVKLYKHEGPQHRLLSIEARAFRDFLLRFAKAEDGVLLESSKSPFRDLCRVVAADSRDARKVKKWTSELIDVGYLDMGDDGKITIKRFVEAQTARSKNAERQARWKAKNKQKEEGDEALPETVTGNASDAEAGNAEETLQREEMRRDEKRASKLACSKLKSRLVTFERSPGSPPSPRKDPLNERIPFKKWFPSQQWLDWWREVGLSDSEQDRVLSEVRNKVSGAWDVEWWDGTVLKFFESKLKLLGKDRADAQEVPWSN